MNLRHYLKQLKIEKQYFNNYKELIDSIKDNKIIKKFNFTTNSNRDFGTIITLKNKIDMEINPDGTTTRFQRKIEKMEHLGLINEYLSEVLELFKENGLFLSGNPFLNITFNERPVDEVVLNNDYIVYEFKISFKKNLLSGRKKLEFFVNVFYKIILPIIGILLVLFLIL